VIFDALLLAFVDQFIQNTIWAVFTVWVIDKFIVFMRGWLGSL